MKGLLAIGIVVLGFFLLFLFVQLWLGFATMVLGLKVLHFLLVILLAVLLAVLVWLLYKRMRRR